VGIGFGEIGVDASAIAGVRRTLGLVVAAPARGWHSNRRRYMMHRTWRNGVGSLAVALLMAAGGLVGTTAAAAAASTDAEVASSFYMIVHSRTGKCVDVPGSSHRSFQTVQEWECHGGANQRWAAIDEQDDGFVLISMNTPTLCMAVGADFLIKQMTSRLSRSMRLRVPMLAGLDGFPCWWVELGESS
jgi:hypothetical protein